MFFGHVQESKPQPTKMTCIKHSLDKDYLINLIGNHYFMLRLLPFLLLLND